MKKIITVATSESLERSVALLAEQVTGEAAAVLEKFREGAEQVGEFYERLEKTLAPYGIRAPKQQRFRLETSERSNGPRSCILTRAYELPDGVRLGVAAGAGAIVPIFPMEYFAQARFSDEENEIIDVIVPNPAFLPRAHHRKQFVHELLKRYGVCDAEESRTNKAQNRKRQERWHDGS